MKEIRKQIKAQRRKTLLINKEKKVVEILNKLGDLNLDIAKSLFRYAASKNHYDVCAIGKYAFTNENEINEAIEMYEIAGLKGNHPDGLYNCGNIYYEKQDYEKAVSYFEKLQMLVIQVQHFGSDTYHRVIEAVSNEGNNDTANMVVDMIQRKR